MVSSCPVIDMSHRLNYDRHIDFIPGEAVPCMCPFHTLFKRLKVRFFPESKGPTWDYECNTRTYVFQDRHGLKTHCDQQKGCWRHYMLSQYLEKIYPRQQAEKKAKRKGNK